MMHVFHKWAWDKEMVYRGTWVQYAKCSVCGKIKVREVLL